jgi:putative oxidoreductase
MDLIATLARLRSRGLEALGKLGGLPPALARLTVGVVFIQSGWGKLQDLPKVTGFFTELGIPFPAANAVLAASTEFFCGILVLIGLATRLATIPLIVTMIVAILTAKRKDLEGVTDLFGLEEFAYIVLFAWICVAGPGKLAIDFLLGKRLDRAGTKAGG